MTVGIGQVHVKKERGVMVVVGRGQTPKGKAYIQARRALKVKSPSDPKFKDELAEAIALMLPESLATPE